MRKYLSVYECHESKAGRRHVWSVVCDAGGLHLWIEESLDHDASRDYGGIEIHYNTRPKYRSIAPNHDDCWLLCGPCWTDGSAIAADDHWIPVWRMDPDDHEGMLSRLRHEAERRFDEESEATDE